MDDETQDKLILGGAILATGIAALQYQYYTWKQAAITEKTLQSGATVTNVTQADMEKFLAGQKMVSAYTGVPPVAPTGLVASICLPLAGIAYPVLNLWSPFEAAVA